MNVLDLFSGIGGFSLGLERAGMRTVAFCEIEPYCRAVLRKHWPDVPCYDDIRTITEKPIQSVDVICGGFPCQPFSVAGERRGKEDNRSLWPEMVKSIRHFNPSWVIGENVAGIVSMELDNILVDLEESGYAAWTFNLPASAVGARHSRERIWIVAHSERIGQSGSRLHGGRINQAPSKDRQADWTIYGGEGNETIWNTEPAVDRVAHGIPARMDRLKSLGNAVVPQIPEIIGRAIMQAENITA